MIESILLGILQGLTEFLPVSSSGHLVLAQELLAGFDAPAAAFDVLLHGGTLAAVLVYFRADLFEIIGGLAHPGKGGWRLPILLVAGSVPAGIVGVFFPDLITPLFSVPGVATFGLLATSCILAAAWWIRGRGHRLMGDLTIAGSLLIGAAQALAIIPGISRSGSTIAMGMFIGLSGREAARFSFLLSIPAIGGALMLEGGVLAGTGLPMPYVAGALSAALVGWASIAFLMKLLNRENLLPFAVYCAVVGILSLVFLI
jgi:undecaprenyl-diphosphatase